MRGSDRRATDSHQRPPTRRVLRHEIAETPREISQYTDPPGRALCFLYKYTSLALKNAPLEAYPTPNRNAVTSITRGASPKYISKGPLANRHQHLEAKLPSPRRPRINTLGRENDSDRSEEAGDKKKKSIGPLYAENRDAIIYTGDAWARGKQVGDRARSACGTLHRRLVSAILSAADCIVARTKSDRGPFVRRLGLRGRWSLGSHL